MSSTTTRKTPSGATTSVPSVTLSSASTESLVLGLPTPPTDRGNSADNFHSTADLINSADEKFQKYKNGRGVKMLNKAGDKLSVIQTDVTNFQSYASPLQGIMDTEPAKAVSQTISALVDGLPALLKVLDDVAQIHPFIKIAVGAFRIAVELDLKRRDNDKKIALLFVEMRDMMAVLVQLQDIDRDKRVGEENQTIQSRMENLVTKTEQDIRKCANACSAYSKKRTFSKVLHSSSWDDTFKGYVQGFTTRRGEFEFELSMYLGRAVNTANSRLVTIEEKMDRLTRYFQACMSPEERDLTRMIEENNGPEAVMNNKTLLRKLYDDKSLSSLSESSERRAGGHHEMGDDFEELVQELKVDTETAIHENLEQFERKFIIQQRELQEEMRRAMHRQGDRIIEAVTSGPHDRILDPDIHEIWKEMNWRGNVKARHFVLALRDHFREKLDDLKRAKKGAASTVPARQFSEKDEWTLEYVNITRLQPIIEAFDDDASGFITVAEVNAFTTARPDDWSLLHWLAYWAVGFQMVMTKYAQQIDVVMAKMFSLKAQVLPANRNSVEKYLNTVWAPITALTTAFRRATPDLTLLARFESYDASEVARLRENLKTARYDFDARDTLELVRGPGRIDKHVFPLLYLLLSRDFEIMRLARTCVIHVDELFDAADTIVWVFDAIHDRCVDLADLFKQQKLDPDQQFKIFGFEMFKYWHDETDFVSMKRLQETRFVERDYDDALEDQNVDPNTIINHPLQTPEEVFAAREFTETESDMQADTHVRALIGHWSGFCMTQSSSPCQTMDSFDIHVDPKNASAFQCSGVAANGTNWKMSGGYVVPEDGGEATYTFVMTYAARFASQSFRGTIRSHGTELSGSWAYGESPLEFPHKFIFKRLSSELMRFWPTPVELAENKNRAMWKFAISAVCVDIRRRLWRWAWLKSRWENGQRFAELIRKWELSDLSDEENLDLALCRRLMTPEEARLYSIFIDMRERRVPLHFGVTCDACGADIRGTRIVCLSCGACGAKDTIDLCDKPGCSSATIDMEKRNDLTKPHNPSHDVFKVPTAIHFVREYGEMHRAALKALKRARAVLSTTGVESQNSKDAKVSDRQSSSDAAPSVVDPSPENLTKPACLKCGQTVSHPCWFCIECRDSDEVFICTACDTQHGGITSRKHKATHALVKVQPPGAAEAVDSELTRLNARMSTLEETMKEMQYRLGQSLATVDEKTDLVQTKLALKMDERLEKVEGAMSAMDARLQRIEELLIMIGGVYDASGAHQAGPRPAARQMTWPGTQGGIAESPESEFPSWVNDWSEI